MSTATARTEHRFDQLTVEEVYDAWTKPVLLRRWMEAHLKAREVDAEVTRTEMDVVVGGKYLFADSREGSEAWGYYKVLEPPERIAFSWFVSAEEEVEDNSLVTIELMPSGSGCVAAVSHEMSDEWADYVDRTAAAWQSMLEAIDRTLSGH